MALYKYQATSKCYTVNTWTCFKPQTGICGIMLATVRSVTSIFSYNMASPRRWAHPMIIGDGMVSQSLINFFQKDVDLL